MPEPTPKAPLPNLPPANVPPQSKHRDSRARTVGWRTRDFVRGGAIIMGLYILGLLLWEARTLALLTFLGVLFGLAVAAGVDLLQRLRIPRGIAAGLIVLGTLGIMASVVAWSAPTLRAQSDELREKFPQAVDRVERWLDQHRSGLIGAMFSSPSDTNTAVIEGPRASPADDTLAVTVAVRADTAGKSPLRTQLLSRLSGLRSLLFPFVTSTVIAVGAILYLIFLAIYVGAEPDVYHSGLMHLFPQRTRMRAAEVLTAIGITLRRWLVTQLIAMLAIGVVTTVALLVLGIPAALPLGIIAGFLEFIPTVGPVLSAIPAVIMGFVDSPEKAGVVAVVYIGIQFLENHILIPLLMREGVDLPPALTITAQALMATLFGFLGLLVAVPALAATMVAVRMLYVEDVVGDDLTVLDAGEDSEPASSA